jgi:hypothetical protein
MATKPALKSLFKGKDTPAEEKKEARAVKSGKISPAQYAKGEKMEGEKDKKSTMVKRAQDMKSGKMSPAAYAKMERKGYKK